MGSGEKETETAKPTNENSRPRTCSRPNSSLDREPIKQHCFSDARQMTGLGTVKQRKRERESCRANIGQRRSHTHTCHAWVSLPTVKRHTHTKDTNTCSVCLCCFRFVSVVCFRICVAVQPNQDKTRRRLPNYLCKYLFCHEGACQPSKKDETIEVRLEFDEFPSPCRARRAAPARRQSSAQ